MFTTHLLRTSEGFMGLRVPSANLLSKVKINVKTDKAFGGGGKTSYPWITKRNGDPLGTLGASLPV